jgi:tetratricopeptide (TPR) repeat protein
MEESMRLTKRLTAALVIILIVAPVIYGVKLPQSAYIKSAKIALYSDNPRLDEAIMMLDSMLYYYGPAPEAYFLRANIYAEHASKAPDPQTKLEKFAVMSANYDSLALACENPDLKKDLKKDCKKLNELADSVRVKYWGENYNDGVLAIEKMDKEISPKIKEAPDSVAAQAARDEMKIVGEKAKYSFLIAAVIKPKDYRAYEGVGLTYDRAKDLDSAIIWFEKAYERADTATHIIQNIAYAYVQKDDNENSIKYFKKYLERVPNDVNTIFNIAICYSNLKQYDSSLAYDLKAIAADSTLVGPYIDAGQYYLIRSQAYSDSIRTANQEKKGSAADQYAEIRDALLDSSAAYLAVATRLDPENIGVMEQYGVVKLVAGHFADAGEIFKKLTELEPTRKDHWVSLGDIYVQLQKFADAIIPYEKAVELDPGDGEIWKVLRDLYQNLNMPDKAKKADEKMNELEKL